VDNLEIEGFLILININNKNSTDKAADFDVINLPYNKPYKYIDNTQI